MDDEERDSLRRWRWVYVPTAIVCSSGAMICFGGVAYVCIVEHKWYGDLAFMGLLGSASAMYCVKCIRDGSRR